MSAKNPRKAMAALLPLAVKCPCGETVRPMTLGMWAALERIGSPLITGEPPKDALELIPSLYLLTHDPREVLASGFFDAAVAWADSLPVTALGEIRDACYRQMDAMGDVLPEEKKKTRRRATAGSRGSSTGRRRSTAGASGKSSGISPSARSHFCGGSPGLPKAKSSRSLK